MMNGIPWCASALHTMIVYVVLSRSAGLAGRNDCPARPRAMGPLGGPAGLEGCDRSPRFHNSSFRREPQNLECVELVNQTHRITLFITAKAKKASVWATHAGILERSPILQKKSPLGEKSLPRSMANDCVLPHLCARDASSIFFRAWFSLATGE